MKKKLVFFVFLLLSPVAILAQAAGGQITRKKVNTMTVTKNKTVQRTTQSKHQSSRKNEQMDYNNYSKEELFEMGSVLYNKGAFEEAVTFYRKSAEKGHIEAQSELGHMYFHGEGVSVNYSEAVKWLDKASQNGDILSQYTLGQMYEKGIGVTIDKDIAMKLYSKAAPHFYEAGKKSMRNDGEMAISLFEMVRNMKSLPYSVFSSFQIGIIYYYGFGGKSKDFELAKRFFLEAVNHNNKPAMYYLVLCYQNGENNSYMANYYKNKSGYSSPPNWDF